MRYIKHLYTVCFTLISSLLFAANNNPASVEYVDNKAATTAQSLQKLTAGDGISISGTSIATTATRSVGDLYQGGVVFYVDNTKRHGLAVALSDQNSSAALSTITPNEFPSVNGLGAGMLMTIGMQAFNRVNDTATTTAPAHAANWSVASNGTTTCLVTSTPSVSSDCIGGWYLGAAGEYKLLADNLTAVNQAITANGGTAITTDGTTKYWTITVVSGSTTTAFTLDFSTGTFSEEAYGNTHPVRAIRQF